MQEILPHDRLFSCVCPMRSAQFVARVVEDGGVLAVGDVAARLKGRRARLEADDNVRDAVHAAALVMDGDGVSGVPSLSMGVMVGALGALSVRSAVSFVMEKKRRRRAFSTTQMLDRLIAAAPIMGESLMPNTG